VDDGDQYSDHLGKGKKTNGVDSFWSPMDNGDHFPLLTKKEKKKSPSVSHFCSHMVGGDNFWLPKEKKTLK
jgi:hypothetical protein